MSYTAAGTGPPQTAAATGVNELTLPSPLPVQAGDIVAVNCPPGAPSPFTTSGTKGSIYGVLNPTLTDGNTGTAKTFPGDEMLINADFVGAPTLTSIAPSSGSFRGGVSVVITGTNFSGATSVSFGGAPAKSFTVNSDTQISAISPPTSRPASLAVAVTTVAGTATSSTAFTTTACVVPKLKGKRLKADRKKLKRADCKLGRVKKSNGAGTKTGKVVKQSPKPGKLLAPGSKVSVKLGG